MPSPDFAEAGGPSGVSVALCTRNGAAYIVEQLRSILAQTLLPDEIIVSDDGSQDGTVALVEAEFATHQSQGVQFRLVRNPEPLGVARNFEQAIALCSGAFVALSDQDDVWHPERLARMAAFFRSSPEVMLMFSDAELVDASGAPLGESLFEGLSISVGDRDALRNGPGFDVLLRRNLVTGATTMFRRRLADLAAPFPDAWIHDEWLAMIASVTGGVRLIDEPLVAYRQHGSNEIGAGSLSFAGKLRRLREPGRARNERLYRRAVVLSARLDELDGVLPPGAREKAREKVQHEGARVAYPRSRAVRWIAVAREFRTGRYTRYGQGVADVVRDLVQPYEKTTERTLLP
jgi:glycosyltransferase involved in cell wall biosynthesis